MPRKTLVLFQILFLCSIFLHKKSCHAQDAQLKNCGFSAIYNFGSSVSDTGNLITLNPKGWYSSSPYGMTIHRATGRASDGLLMIDYIAKQAGLPLVEPYLKLKATKQSTTHGVNFAVGGATALSPEALAVKNITKTYAKASAAEELGWLDDYLKQYCQDAAQGCRKVLESSLFVMNFGGNDYSTAFNTDAKYTFEDMKKIGLVTDVVRAIKDAVTKFINVGATRVIVFGESPRGCYPSFLDFPPSNNSDAYDNLHCVKDVNNVIMYHNQLLQESLEELRKIYPQARIAYADLYNANYYVLNNIQSLGFKTYLKACCEVQNKENVVADKDKLCGAYGTIVCSNPGEYVSWDGLHTTQRVNELLINWLLPNILPKLQCGGAA